MHYALCLNQIPKRLFPGRFQFINRDSNKGFLVKTVDFKLGCFGHGSDTGAGQSLKLVFKRLTVAGINRHNETTGGF